ncbi:MAG: replication-associated recombination protein A [Patescibacteria group bacterium]
MSDMFDYQLKKTLAREAPLADRMRPTALEDFVGQDALTAPGSLLRTLLLRGEPPSMILWGPPGTGKTTLARIIARMTSSAFVQLSAVAGGLAELRTILQDAEERRKMRGTRTILFLDEIHRWNKSQQDALLPYVEDGRITLIGATTENPSFEVNSALLSRARVFTLALLSPDALRQIIRRALVDSEHGLGGQAVVLSAEAEDFLASVADGDARVALSALELAVAATPPNASGVIQLEKKTLSDALQKRTLRYDRAGAEHYNIISALHKSMRGSDADAALYWLGRMLEAGEDPLYVARRLIRFASEDIGLADPQALPQAVAAYHAAHCVGMPECSVNLAQAVAYLARAPKSNALYRAYGEVKNDLRECPNEPVPLHLRNASTALMKELGYGAGYRYNPDHEESVEQDYLPPGLKGRKYFQQ